MPCRDDLIEKSTLDDLRDKIHELTSMLCEVCDKNVELTGFNLPPRVNKWWCTHEKYDRSRGGGRDLQRERDNLRVLEEQVSQLRREIEKQESLLKQTSKIGG